MIRKLLTAATGVGVLLLSVLAPGADAQGNAQCSFTEEKDMVEVPVLVLNNAFSAEAHFPPPPKCEPQKVYPGPFRTHPAAPNGAFGNGALNITAAAPAVAATTATGGGDATAPLAATGAGTDSLLRASLALIAAGATALGTRRHHAERL